MMVWTKVKVAVVCVVVAGMLVICTAEDAAEKPAVVATQADDSSAIIVRTYDVWLLLELERMKCPNATMEHVQDLIMTEVEPQSWVDNGPGRIETDKDGRFVIWHTAAGHGRIAQFIQKKIEEGTPVVVEMKTVTIEKEKIPPELLDPATKKFRGGYMDEGQLSALMRIENTIVGWPRVTVLDGGETYVDVSTDRNYVALQAPTTRPDGTKEYKTGIETVSDGIRSEVGVKVSKDRKQVQLRLHPVIRKLLTIELRHTKPERKGEAPISYQEPMVQTIDSKVDIAVQDGQWFCFDGQEIVGEWEGRGNVNAMVIMLVKATIITATSKDDGRETGAIQGGK